IALPAPGTIEIVSGEETGDRIGYVFQSFTRPPIAFLADARSGKAAELVALPTPPRLDPAVIAVDQTKYRSRDGTDVTLFLLHRTDVTPTGRIPTVLNGYGGFNISRTPVYSAGIAAWVEAGGLLPFRTRGAGGRSAGPGHRAGISATKRTGSTVFNRAAKPLTA